MDFAELSWKRLDNKQNKYVYFQCLRSQFQKKMDFNGNEGGAEDDIGEGPSDIDPDPGFSLIFAQCRIFCGRLIFSKKDDHISFL